MVRLFDEVTIGMQNILISDESAVQAMASSATLRNGMFQFHREIKIMRCSWFIGSKKFFTGLKFTGSGALHATS
jgi:hypothetical protein